MTALSFIFFTCSVLSLWIRRDSKIWGSLLGLSLLSGFIAGNILFTGLLFLIGLIAIWLIYIKKPNLVLFLTIVLITTCFKLHLIPGFHPVFFTPKFQVGLENAVVGFIPIALFVSLSRSIRDWKKVFKGLLAGCVGIGILALLATMTHATQWNFKIPAFMAIRTWSNLILTAIPEEGFYRGFLQRRLSLYFQDTIIGNIAALILTSIVFTFAHIYWSPNAAILGFVFLASLLYGGVYLISGKIESAILCHFLLNLIHMTFFEYHAM